MAVKTMSRSAPRTSAQPNEHYDALTIWFHWLTVGLVTILWTLGQVTGWLPRGSFRSGLWSTHVALGLILALGLAMRILWRTNLGNIPEPEGGDGPVARLAANTKRITAERG